MYKDISVQPPLTNDKAGMVQMREDIREMDWAKTSQIVSRTWEKRERICAKNETV